MTATVEVTPEQQAETQVLEAFGMRWPDSTQLMLEEIATSKGPIDRPPTKGEYLMAPRVDAIAKCLIPLYHRTLEGVRIEYVYKDEMTEKGVLVYGKASKLTARERYFSDGRMAEPPEFVIVINWKAFQVLEPLQRCALVDHELLHCVMVQDNEKGPTPTLLPHDLEEFTAIVERWGLWRPSVREMYQAFQQLSLDLPVQADAVAAAGGGK